MTELTVITDRDLKIAYIKNGTVWGHPGKADFILKNYIIEEMNRETYTLSCNIIEAYNDGVHEICIDDWCSKAYDRLILDIDWTILNQCPECHTYFDNGDGTDDDRFCSDDCQNEYVEEAPDKGER